MAELLPCPFCGGEAQLYTWHKSWVIHGCNVIGGYIYVREFDTEAEAIAAWNTRVNGSETAKTSDNAPLRTCHIEYPYYGDAPIINGQPRCSECKTEFAVGTFPHYCPNCGAKVVS